MCSGTVFDAWQGRCLEALLALDGVEPGLLIIDARDRPSHRAIDRFTRLARSENLLWKGFNDGFVARRSEALRKVDLGAAFASVPQLECRVTKRGRWSEIFADADVEAINDHRLDFILRFAFGIVRGRVLEAARFGIWSFHHDDEAVYRGGPPCFWEIYEGDAVTGVMLQRLTDRLDAGVVLHKGHVRTVASSYAKNSDAAHFAGASFPAKICGDIRAGVVDHLEGEPARADAPIRHNPTNRQMLTFLARVARGFVGGQVRSSLFRDHWNVGVVDAPIERFLDPAFVPDTRWLPSPAGRKIYVADPFGIESRDVILVEAYDQRTQKGVIRAIDAASGAGSDGESVIPESEHTSYPFLLTHESQIYCVPESARARGVRLFRATRFPSEWEAVATLVPDVAAVDPTIVRHADRWWLFFTDRDVDSNADLHVWHAPDLFGPWEPHTSNPVKTDVRSSRPAGTPFVHDGRLYRPAQDCSTTYGGGLVINEVEVLTAHRFRERVVRAVRPDPRSPYPSGCHTLSAAGTRTLIDGKRRVFAGRESGAMLLAKCRRALERRH
ncbi:MAG TPA: hypothetical protein VIK61_03805 [Acidimicrobiia bacterium]